jgi:hypothetical protein
MQMQRIHACDQRQRDRNALDRHIAERLFEVRDQRTVQEDARGSDGE